MLRIAADGIVTQNAELEPPLYGPGWLVTMHPRDEFDEPIPFAGATVRVMKYVRLNGRHCYQVCEPDCMSHDAFVREDMIAQVVHQEGPPFPEPTPTHQPMLRVKLDPASSPPTHPMTVKNLPQPAATFEPPTYTATRLSEEPEDPVEFTMIEHPAFLEMTPLEKGEILAAAIKEHGWTQQHAAEQYGIKQVTQVSLWVRLADAPDEIKERLRSGEISAVQARKEIAALRRGERAKARAAAPDLEALIAEATETVSHLHRVVAQYNTQLDVAKEQIHELQQALEAADERAQILGQANAELSEELESLRGRHTALAKRSVESVAGTPVGSPAHNGHIPWTINVQAGGLLVVNP